MFDTLRIIANTATYLWLRAQRKGFRPYHASLFAIMRHQRRRLA